MKATTTTIAGRQVRPGWRHPQHQRPDDADGRTHQPGESSARLPQELEGQLHHEGLHDSRKRHPFPLGAMLRIRGVGSIS